MDESLFQQLQRGRFTAWLKVVIGLSLVITAISLVSELL